MKNACACLGPMYGEPHCPCEMEQLGLPLNTVAREQAAKLSKEDLKGLEVFFQKNRIIKN